MTGKPNKSHPEATRRLLTDGFVRGLKPAAPGTRNEFWDSKIQGFGIRVSDRGTMSYVLYRRFPPTNTPARRELGRAGAGGMSLAAARQRAREWLDLIEQGIDPREQQRKAQAAQVRQLRTTFEVVGRLAAKRGTR